MTAREAARIINAIKCSMVTTPEEHEALIIAVRVLLGEHQEYVKVTRCKECVAQKTCRIAQYLGNEGYCSQGKRWEEVEGCD